MEARGLLERIADAGSDGGPRRYPNASLKLAPGFGCARNIRFAHTATAWPEELDATEFSVTDPQPERELPHGGAPLGAVRRAAVLGRLTLVSAAAGVRVFVAFSPARGVLIHPDGRQEERDTRAERRLERRRRRALERERRPRLLARAARRREALAMLMDNPGTTDSKRGGLQ